MLQVRNFCTWRFFVWKEPLAALLVRYYDYIPFSTICFVVCATLESKKHAFVFHTNMCILLLSTLS